MRKKITVTFLAICMIATILPLAVKAEKAPELNLRVNTVSYHRNGQLNYTFTYTLRNEGPDDLENRNFSDAAGFKIGEKWYVHQDSWVHHVNYYLEASHNSEEFSWTGDTPSGLKWFCQCTDEYNNIAETNEDDNCLVKLWYFY